jgi:beta-lactamase superfamily II metal-dependent hydrolase
MAWDYSFDTHVWIFSVGRGNAAFIRTGMNHGFILDMNSTEFDVAKFIKDKFVCKLDSYKDNKIAQAILSHPHGDHIVQCSELKKGSPLYPTLLTCPHAKDSENGSPNEKVNWTRICNRDTDAENVETYKSLYSNRNLPLQTIQYAAGRNIPNLEYGLFYIRPPVCEKLHPNDDNEYGNSTSIMFYLRHGTNSVLFPGDMTPEGMEHILNEREGLEKRYTKFDSKWAANNGTHHAKTDGQPSLRSLLQQGLTILVAPHHGLESCHSPALFGAIKGGRPKMVVISERRKAHEGDGSTHPNYARDICSSGLRVQIEGREEIKGCLTTKEGHHILAVLENSGGTKVYTEKDPEKLLAVL